MRKIWFHYKNIFQEMLSCLLSDTIYAEEQKLISLLGLYTKAATLRLELFEE